MSTFPDRDVVHVVLLPISFNDIRMRNWMAIAWMRTISDSLLETVCVDHGHGKSNGESHCSFVLKPIPDQCERHANVPEFEQEVNVHESDHGVSDEQDADTNSVDLDAEADGHAVVAGSAAFDSHVMVHADSSELGASVHGGTSHDQVPQVDDFVPGYRAHSVPVVPLAPALFGHLGPGLPPGWEQTTDPASGRPYWYNRSTGMSQWTPPLWFGGASMVLSEDGAAGEDDMADDTVGGVQCAWCLGQGSIGFSSCSWCRGSGVGS